jgi:phenylacetate-CoA ligase
MLGYPSAMYSIARAALERGLEAPRLAVVISNAERLYDFQREAISKAYGCRVQNTYGQGEISCAASECAHGTMHLWPDVGVTEWLRDGSDEAVEEGASAGSS